MKTPAPPTPRILVGAGSFADAATALRIVERLASGVPTGLGGVLVEEVNTLAICQIPDQRIVLVSGATVLAPNQSQVRTLLEADARAFRQSLARTAKTTGANWVFAQEAGDLVGTALRAAVGWDILVIGYRHVHAARGKIVLLEGPEGTGDDMEQAASVLAHGSSPERIVFSVDPDSDAATSARRPGTVAFQTLDDALTALARTNAQAVLVDLARGPVRSPDDLDRLLEVSRCPLIVFGASKAHAMLEHTAHTPPAPHSGDRSSER